MDPIFKPTDDQKRTLSNYEKKLESVRNNITLNDAEVVRLKRLIESLSYTVRQISNSKQYLEEELEKLSNNKKLILIEIKDKKDTVISLNKKISEKEAILVAKKEEESEANSRISDANSEYCQAVKSQEERETRLNEISESLNSREEKIKNQERDVLEKKISIEKAIGDIKQIIEKIK